MGPLSTSLPVCLHRYLSDGDDGVSEAIITFATQYIGILKVWFKFIAYVCMYVRNLLNAIFFSVLICLTLKEPVFVHFWMW